MTPAAPPSPAHSGPVPPLPAGSTGPGLHGLPSHLGDRSGPEVAEEIRRLVTELWDHLEDDVIAVGGDAAARQPGPDGWSVVSRLAAVEGTLSASANRVLRIVDQGGDGPGVVVHPRRTAPPVVPEARPVHALLRNVSQAAERLARLAESTSLVGRRRPSSTALALRDVLVSALVELDAHTSAIATRLSRHAAAS